MRPIEEIAHGSDETGNEGDLEPEFRYGEVYLSYILTYEPNVKINYQAYNFSLDTVLDYDWDAYTYPGGEPDVSVNEDITGNDSGWRPKMLCEPDIG